VGGPLTPEALRPGVGLRAGAGTASSAKFERFSRWFGTQSISRATLRGAKSLVAQPRRPQGRALTAGSSSACRACGRWKPPFPSAGLGPGYLPRVLRLSGPEPRSSAAVRNRGICPLFRSVEAGRGPIRSAAVFGHADTAPTPPAGKFEAFSGPFPPEEDAALDHNRMQVA
jgi:hypothetical protein